MNDTPTPRTDEEIFEHPSGYEVVISEVAYQLERELTEARKLAEKYRNLSCDSQEEADETLLPWETTNQNEP
jgi:hypothetical protein